MKGNKSIYIGRALVMPLFLLIIEVLVRAKTINPFFVAEPSNFLSTLARELAGGELLTLTARTMTEVGIAFALCSVIGISIGYTLWKFPTAGTAYETFLGAVMASPVVLLYPIFLIFFGRTPASIIALNAITSTIPIVLNTRHGLMDVNPGLIKVGKSMNLSDRKIFQHILLPAAVPMIFSGLRLGIIYMLLGIIALEYIVSIGGLGWFISDKAFRFEAPELYAAISLVLLFQGVTLAVLVAAWEIAGLVNPALNMFFPSIEKILAKSAQMLISGQLNIHLATTGYEVLWGFSLGAGLGISVGIVLGSTRLLGGIFEPFVLYTASIPKIIFYPLFILVLGVGVNSKIGIGVVSAFFPIAINTMAGVKEVSPAFIKAARTLGASTWNLYTKVY